MIDFEGKHIGLFGGTFDPFHNAHRQLIVSALEQLPLDVMWRKVVNFLKFLFDRVGKRFDMRI
jgi:cytidyltransferase-like protein